MVAPTSDPDATWVITGPTASGKSRLALELAEARGFEIASMDSMAVYRRMDIGTAKPSAAERARVPHHLLDLVDPHESFDTARYCATARALIEDTRRIAGRLLFVGGTPLYLMALFKGMMDGPAADPALREALRAREAIAPGSLHAELAARDPAAAERIHRNDQKRLVRALEVLELTGRPISEQQDTFDSPGFRLPCRIVAISRPRDELHARVRERTIRMLDAGLIGETEAIRDSGGFSPEAASAIGYAECLCYLEGGYQDLEELRNMIRRATHRLIRRQTTWLRRIPEVAWVGPEQRLEAVLDRLRG